MKTLTLLLLATASLLPAQTPAKKPPAPASKPVAAASAATLQQGHATLADLQRDFQEKKFAALDLYAKTHAEAKDAGDALDEAVNLAQTLKHHDHVLRLTETYLKAHADGSHALAMHSARGEALSGKGDLVGAQKSYETAIEMAGDNIQGMVAATTALAEMLVSNGKKDEAKKVLADAGEKRSDVRGLKEHLEGIAANYDIIGSEPKAMGQNDIAGKAIDLAEYKGKVLLIDFWATWCGPCMAELPNVIAAYDKFHGQGFEILGISFDEDREAFDKCVADRKMTWRHHYDGKGWKNEIGQAYGISSIPATYLIGKDGKVVAVGLRGDALEKQLTKLLGEKNAPPSAPKK